MLNPARFAPCEDLLSGSTLRLKRQPSIDVCEILSSDTRQENDSSPFDLLLQCIVLVCRVGHSVENLEFVLDLPEQELNLRKCTLCFFRELGEIPRFWPPLKSPCQFLKSD